MLIFLDCVADNSDKVIKRKYWALVIGKPAKQKGRIVAPLKKVRVCVCENRKFD